MKFKIRIPLVISLFAAVLLSASPVTFKWSQTPDSNSVSGYVLIGSTNSFFGSNQSPALAEVNVGTNLSVTVDFTNSGRWFFAAKAYDTNGIYSKSSNELMVEIPTPPSSFRLVTIEHSIDLTGTNWNDVGYFKLRINP